MELSFFEDEKLLRIFQENKTEMSLMENPLIFIQMLKDHRLIPEEKYMELKEMTIKEKREEAVYDMLAYIEKEMSCQIRTFWKCVSEEVILSRYPTLQKLYRKLSEELRENNNSVRGGNLQHLDHTEMRTNVAAQNKETAKMITSTICDDEQPRPSTQQTSGEKKKAKKTTLSPLIKGKKKLLVTCGDKEGKLTRCKLAAGAKCIEARNEGRMQWFTPNEFQEYGGMGSSKNWKKSIRFNGKTLEKLIKDGHLKLH